MALATFPSEILSAIGSFLDKDRDLFSLHLCSRQFHQVLARDLQLRAFRPVNDLPAVVFAAQVNDLACLKYLLLHAGDVRCRLAFDVDERSPDLELVQEEGKLAEKIYGKAALAWAAECGHQEVVELLLGAGANINAIGDHPVTEVEDHKNEQSQVVSHPLIHPTVHFGGMDVFGVSRIDQSEPRARGNTAMHAAVAAGHVHIVELLISKGADLRINGSHTFRGTRGVQTSYGNAIHHSVLNARPEILKVLVEQGFSVSQVLFIQKGLAQARDCLAHKGMLRVRDGKRGWSALDESYTVVITYLTEQMKMLETMKKADWQVMEENGHSLGQENPGF